MGATQLILILTISLRLCILGNSARILAIFTSPSISHQKMFQSLWWELALRGHNVTAASPNILHDKTLQNLKEIDLHHAYDTLIGLKPLEFLSKNCPHLKKFFGYFDMMQNAIEDAFLDKEVHELLQSDEKFDVIILQAVHPLLFALKYRFKAPVIGVSSYGVLLNMHDAIGNPTHPIITPDLIFTYDNDMNFWVKVNSFLYNIWYRMLYYWYELPKSDKIARKYFGDDMPYLGDIIKNISLLMVNVNPILNPIRANVPNIIEMNQIHIKKPEPLPKDIKEYLDASSKGVVYFSLGSNIKSANLPNQTKEAIISALAELPYNVLWKWEADHLPGQPKNVMVRKWLPQQDILGHPNIKVFVTQGGLQSAEEAIVKGVPIVGIPFIADQPRNVDAMVKKGLGLRVDAETLTKEILRDAIHEVATNKKYKEGVLKAKMILEDQPLKGLDKAMWWIEYVIRHKDLSHLRSPAADMSFFEYFMVDVILFCSFVFLLSIYLVKKTICLLWRLVRSKPPSKLKKN